MNHRSTPNNNRTTGPAKARQLRKNLTDAERLLWAKLRRRQLENCKFRRQHPIGNFIVDFVCLDKKLVIEVDGGQHLDNPYDDRRTHWLEEQGYKVLRFWNHDVLAKTDAVLQAIHDALLPTRHA
jgi:very-short-patch-repair endonuclease